MSTLDMAAVMSRLDNDGMRAYRSATRLLAVVTIGLGIALLALTLSRGGGVGILIGLLFVAAGAGRLYLLRGSRR
jgi:hypothetical protein